MGLTGSKPKTVVQERGEALYLEEDDKTYLGEPFTKAKASFLHPISPPPSEAPISMPICSLNHAAIEATDVDKICEFYVQVLGFQELPRPELGFRGHWLEVGTERKLMLHIIEKDPSVPRSIINWKDLYENEPEAWYIRRACHLAFEVTDFDAAEKALRAHGVEYSRHVLPEIGMRQLFFYDPEGHGVEIGQYDDSRRFFREKGVEPPN